jgi:hypothetical protein
MCQGHASAAAQHSEMSGIRLVLFDMNNRTLGHSNKPCSPIPGAQCASAHMFGAVLLTPLCFSTVRCAKQQRCCCPLSLQGRLRADRRASEMQAEVREMAERLRAAELAAKGKDRAEARAASLKVRHSKAPAGRALVEGGDVWCLSATTGDASQGGSVARVGACQRCVVWSVGVAV